MSEQRTMQFRHRCEAGSIVQIPNEASMYSGNSASFSGSLRSISIAPSVEPFFRVIGMRLGIMMVLPEHMHRTGPEILVFGEHDVKANQGPSFLEVENLDTCHHIFTASALFNATWWQGMKETAGGMLAYDAGAAAAGNMDRLRKLAMDALGPRTTGTLAQRPIAEPSNCASHYYATDSAELYVCQAGTDGAFYWFKTANMPAHSPAAASLPPPKQVPQLPPPAAETCRCGESMNHEKHRWGPCPTPRPANVYPWSPRGSGR